VNQENVEALQKSTKILKSVNSSSVNKPAEKTFDLKITEIRSPSPILEDPIEEEVSKQSTSLETFDKEKKIKEKDNYKKGSLQEQKKNEETSEAEKLEEQRKEKKEKSEEEQSGDIEKNNSKKTAEKISETNKGSDKEENIESDAMKSVVAPIQTTQLRGKSKATGQIMGGWI